MKHETQRLLFTAGLLLLSSVTAAQTPPPVQPKLFAEFMPRGAAGYDARGKEPNDPMIVRMVVCNAQYPSIDWHTLPHSNTINPQFWSPSTLDASTPSYLPGEGLPNVRLIGRRLALEAIRRGFLRPVAPGDPLTPAADLALNLLFVGQPRPGVRTVVGGGPTSGVIVGVVTLKPNPNPGGSDPSNFIEYPDLYAFERDYPNLTDTIDFDRTRLGACPATDPPTVRKNTRMRTVWMHNGIFETREWVKRVIDAYNEYDTDSADLTGLPLTGEGAVAAAHPSRVIFDQEPTLILCNETLSSPCLTTSSNLTWQDMVEYWQALQQDGRWDSVYVPGCGTQTLASLWLNRDLTQFDTPGDAGDDEPTLTAGPDESRWIGGSKRNQAWFRWFCQINKQAYEGALDEAAFSVIREKWPNSLSSDYDAFRTDKIAQRNYWGTPGDKGLSYPVQTQYRMTEAVAQSDYSLLTTDPAVAHVINTPHLYSEVTAYQWDKFAVAHNATTYNGASRWGNTDDETSPLFGERSPNGRAAPFSRRSAIVANPGDDYEMDLNYSRGIGVNDEFWEESSNRFNRWTLDGIVRENPDLVADTPTKQLGMAWITLPHQPLHFFAPFRWSSSGPGTWIAKYNGRAYQATSGGELYVPMRQSVNATYRSLADARARGYTDFIVWNNTGADADPEFLADPSSFPRGRWGNGEGFYLNRGVHADWPANWDLLRNAVNHVFNYDVSSVTLTNGTWVTPSTGAVGALKYADEQTFGTPTASRSFCITSAISGSLYKTRVQIEFTPRDDTGLLKLGTSINLSLRLKSLFGPDRDLTANASPVIDVYVHNGAGGGFWLPLGATSDGADGPATVDLDGRLFLNGKCDAIADQFSTITTRFPYSRVTDLENPGFVGLDGTIKLRVTLNLPVAASPTTTPKLYVDHATVFLSDEAYRDSNHAPTYAFLLPGDLNSDGTVNAMDTDLFKYLAGVVSTPPGTNGDTPMFKLFADYNRDGAVTYDTNGTTSDPTNDRYYWDSSNVSLFNVGTAVSGNQFPFDALSAKRIDAARQSATDVPHPCPGCFADVGMQGGLPGSDCLLDNNDFVVFINFFFDNNPLADVGSQGGVPPGDGLFDNNDFVVFINFFFQITCAPEP